MKTIWIDAGHGGTASGATFGKRMEKDDALRFALELERQFKRQGCATVMTRRTDTQLTKGTDNDQELSARAKLERDNKCNLAISCHRNAAVVSARGVEAWVHSRPDSSVVNWASDIMRSIAALGIPLRAGTAAPGVYKGYRDNPKADYAVNSLTNSPSALLELGFITASQDNAFFDANISPMCAAVVKASCKFLGIPYTTPDTGGSTPLEPEDIQQWKERALAAEDALQQIRKLVG